MADQPQTWDPLCDKIQEYFELLPQADQLDFRPDMNKFFEMFRGASLKPKDRRGHDDLWQKLQGAIGRARQQRSLARLDALEDRLSAR